MKSRSPRAHQMKTRTIKKKLPPLAQQTKKVLVIWETDGKKELVGELTQVAKGWSFSYSPKWIKGGVQIDPDLPLRSKPIPSKQLHEFFSERIPPRDSGHFAYYAKIWKLREELKDPMALLVTLGHRGPSNYVFYPEGFAPGRWVEKDLL
jgi:HipA-like protein